jgi:signal recognition particle GTPase
MMAHRSEFEPDISQMSQMVIDGNWEDGVAHVLTIVAALTPDERKDPVQIGFMERVRIAAESGRTVEEVEGFLNQFFRIRELMKRLNTRGVE